MQLIESSHQEEYSSNPVLIMQNYMTSSDSEKYSRYYAKTVLLITEKVGVQKEKIRRKGKKQV